MAAPFKVRFLRGSQAANNVYVGPAGEITIDTENWRVRIHDGQTAGGHSVPNQADLDGALAGFEGGGGAVDSVNGKTGVVALTATDLGLGSVQDYPVADQATAEAADSDAHYMTPLAMRQFMASMGVTQDQEGDWIIDQGVIGAT